MKPKAKIVTGILLIITGIVTFGLYPYVPFFISIPLTLIGLILTIKTKGLPKVKVITGFILLVSGLLFWLYNFLPPLMFSLPIALFGLTIILFSGLKTWINLLVGLTPIVLIFLFIQIRKGEDEIFLIPKKYNGPVRVYFDQPNGITIKYEEGKRVYEIPESGVLFTNIKDTDYNMTEFYLVNHDNSRTKINLINTSAFDSYFRSDIKETNPLQDTVGILFGIGRSGDYNNFYVGTYRNYKNLKNFSFEEEYIDSIKTSYNNGSRCTTLQ